MKYKITISAGGYDDSTLEVDAASKREAEKSIPEAELLWMRHNDVDSDSLGYTSVTVTQAKLQAAQQSISRHVKSPCSAPLANGHATTAGNIAP